MTMARMVASRMVIERTTREKGLYWLVLFRVPREISDRTCERNGAINED